MNSLRDTCLPFTRPSREPLITNRGRSCTAWTEPASKCKQRVVVSVTGSCTGVELSLLYLAVVGNLGDHSGDVVARTIPEQIATRLEPTLAGTGPAS